MADAYGTLIFSCSEDVQLKGKKNLVEALNNFNWDNSGGKWAIDKTRIFYEGMEVQYPTTYPEQTKSFILQKDGVRTKIDISELTDEQEDFIFDVESEVVSLENLRNLIASFIKKGWIEIACIANEKSRYIYLEELRIYSDGRAHRKNSFIGSNKAFPNTREEEFLPGNITDKVEVI